MKTLLLHLLQSHLILVLFYFIYRFLLARQVWFQMNRAILLSMPVLALLIPFFQFTIPNNPVQTISEAAVQLPVFELTSTVSENSQTNWIAISGFLYTSVFCLLILLMIYRIAKILSISRSNTSDDPNIVLIDGSSFSFFRKIYLDSNLHRDFREMVISHEQVHVRQWHSADAVFYEIISAVFWCNPLIWLMKKEIRDTHEFIADYKMKQQYPQHKYLNALLNATFGSRSIQFLPMFNHSQTLLKRVTMMNLKSLKTQRFRYLIALPLVAVIALAFSCTDKKEELSTSSTVKEEPMTIVDQMPEFPGGQQVLFEYIGNAIQYPEEAKRDSIAGVVYVSFVVEKNGVVDNVEVEKGIGGGCDEVARRVVSEMPNWIPGVHNSQKVRVKINLPIRFKLEE